MQRISKKAPKNTKENSTGTKHKWKTYSVGPREKKGKKKKQRSRILKNFKINA
jgi:hypothetical protein